MERVEGSFAVIEMRINLPESKPLTYEEEASLALQGDWEAIAKPQLPAIVGICNRLATQSVTAEDLLGDAWRALEKAARKWNPCKPSGVRFWTYAQKWIIPAVWESIRQQSGAVVAPKGKDRVYCESMDDDSELGMPEIGREDRGFEANPEDALSGRQRKLLEIRVYEEDCRPLRSLATELGYAEATLRRDWIEVVRWAGAMRRSKTA